MIRIRVMRIGFAAEDAVAIKLDLPPRRFKVLGGVELRVIDLDLVSKHVEAQPDKEVGHQHKTNPVVHHHRRFKWHPLKQVQVADLQASGNQQNKAQRVGPVPDAYRKRIDIELAHEGSLLGATGGISVADADGAAAAARR